MNEEQARQVLEQCGDNFDEFVCWSADDRVALDGAFTVEQLEAILWWAQNKKGVPFP